MRETNIDDTDANLKLITEQKQINVDLTVSPLARSGLKYEGFDEISDITSQQFLD